jgi:hypothetical protein
MEAVSIFKTSVNFYRTARRNIPEDSRLHTRCRENLKSHQSVTVFPEYTNTESTYVTKY